MIRLPRKLGLCVWYAYMIIAKGVPFLLPPGKRIGKAQLADKKKENLTGTLQLKIQAWTIKAEMLQSLCGKLCFLQQKRIVKVFPHKLGLYI